MNNVLFLCYYFPPLGMGGTQRSTKFVKYLPAFNWEPIVVTVKDIEYYAQDESLLAEIKNRKIVRTKSLDPLRLLALFRKKNNINKNLANSNLVKMTPNLLTLLNQIFIRWFFIPDAKIFWLPFAFVTALKLIKKNRIKIIYTTSPPHSSHLAGMLLKNLVKIKWVADFRDAWTNGETQPCPTLFHAFLNRYFEKTVLRTADRVISMCDHLSQNLQRKHGYFFKQKKFITIANGYDNEDFENLMNLVPNKKFTITHCGSISRVSDPEPFLKAIKLLFQLHPYLKQKIKIQFFGIDLFGRLNYLSDKLQLDDCISPIQYLPHRMALKEIMKSHLLLLTINKQTGEEIITGKIFEYLGSGKPILLISSAGEVSKLIRSLKRGTAVTGQKIEIIKDIIYNYFQMFQEKKLVFSKPLSVKKFERKELTKQLALVFSDLIN